MNERLMRAAPKCFAQFITAFEDSERPLMRPQAGLVRTLPARQQCSPHVTLAGRDPV